MRSGKHQLPTTLATPPPEKNHVYQKRICASSCKRSIHRKTRERNRSEKQRSLWDVVYSSRFVILHVSYSLIRQMPVKILRLPEDTLKPAVHNTALIFSNPADGDFWN